MRKALEAGADAVVLDLEDGVAMDQKEQARTNVAALLTDLAGTPPEPEIHLRVNRSGAGYSAEDLRLAASPLVRAVRLPKAEDAPMVRAASTVLAEAEAASSAGHGTTALYPTIESAVGVLEASAIATADPRVARLVLGQADLVADIGAHGDDAIATLVPRSLLVLASRAAGIGAPVDGAFTDLSDEAGLRAALERARALGMFGKSAIHPRQLAAVHEAFTPTPEEVARARRIVDAFDAATRDGSGVTVLDGEMIDLPIVQRAKGLLSLRRNL